MSAYEFSESNDSIIRCRPPRSGPTVQSIAPILVGGIIAAVALAARSPLVAWLRGFLSAARERCASGGLSQGHGGHVDGLCLDRPLWAIRQRLLGRRKSSVAAALGPPRTAVLPTGVVPAGNRPSYWHADTWYYPVPTSQAAMAVKFAAGIARDVVFFEAPGASDRFVNPV